MKECHKCPLNGKHSEECLKCQQEETYQYKFGTYLFDTYTPVQHDTAGSEKATPLPDDEEDALRKAMYALFDLQPLELLVLRGIMRRQTLQQMADELTNLFRRNNKECTRHHVFQLRKSMLKKVPQFSHALLTEGQRRELKA